MRSSQEGFEVCYTWMIFKSLSTFTPASMSRHTSSTETSGATSRSTNP